MGRTFKLGVCVLAIAAVSATTAEARRGNRVSGNCASTAEVSAIQTAAVQQELMVAALTCNQIDNFNAFQTGFGPELRTSDATLMRMFVRLYGGAKGQAEYHSFKTRLANDSEMRSIHGNQQFCAATTQVFAAALSQANKPTLTDFVAGVPVDETSPVNSCAIQVAVGLQGMQVAPNIIPIPKPAEYQDVNAVATLPTPQQQQGGVKVGTLTCDVSSGMGFIFGSSKGLECTYTSTGTQEHYSGTFSKYGLDIGFASKSVLVWTVVAPTSSVSNGALQGDYAGATAGATVGIGLGANVLIGGLDKSIALQPVSVTGSTGINIAAGIGVISLKFEPQT